MFKFTPIKPKTTLKQDAFRVELLAGLRISGKELAAEFEKTTATWEHEKPAFTPKIGLSTGKATLDLNLTGNALGIKKWFWLEDGTPAHPIRPRRKKVLAFRGGYRAKTQPGLIGSRAGGPTGPQVFASGVSHPGAEPRGWAKIIQRRYSPRFASNMQKALERGAKRSGHAL